MDNPDKVGSEKRDYIGTFLRLEEPKGPDSGLKKYVFKNDSNEEFSIEKRRIDLYPKFFVLHKNQEGPNAGNPLAPVDIMYGGKSRRFRKRVKTHRYVKRTKHGTMRVAKKRSNKGTKKRANKRTNKRARRG